jgi:DNA-binding transcriptional MerR regulator
MSADGWTLDELTRQVGWALDGAARAGVYAGAPNGRVRQVPDRRAIRWYTTIGLVDRPLAMRGRTALYGRRHLRQLVAIKRRQAEGLSLAEIQAELVGAGDATLAEVSGIPDLPAGADRGGDAGTGRRFWAERPAPQSTSPPRALPAPTPQPQPHPLPHPLPAPRRGTAPRDDADTVTLLSGVPLADGVTLLIPAAPAAADLEAIAAAAQPLLDVLTARGLIGPADRRSL